MMILNATQWEQWLDENAPECHLLQRSAWGDLKSHFGWLPVRVCNSLAGAQILFRKLPFGFHIAYIPKGPCGPSWRDLWPEIDRVCRERNAIFLRVEPDLWEEAAEGLPSEFPGFSVKQDTIQPRRTVVIDLTGSEEDWLSRMKQKTRYNIRLAQKKDVRVAEVEDIDVFYRLMQQTGVRDGFGVHSRDYYQKAYCLFRDSQRCALLIAYFEDKPLAGVMVFHSGQRAWYLYGASNDEERSRMPTYLLQWEAMRWAAAQGCICYDLYGVPDEDEDALEQTFMERQDGLWGVYRFKRGFGGTLLRSAGAFERVYSPVLYKGYEWLQKLKVSRRRDG